MNIAHVLFDPEPKYTGKEIFLILKGGRGIPGLGLAFFIAVISYFLGKTANVLDVLVLSLIVGIAVRFLIRNNDYLVKLFYPGILIAPIIFIPLGLVFYGIKNLNFLEFFYINPEYIALEILVVIAFFLSIILLGKLLKMKREITYLTATGSGVCGASAIIITSPAVSAEPDDISVSLISVFIAALLGFFVIFPAIAKALGMDNLIYALFSGMVMQFTGFVKLAVDTMPVNIPIVISQQSAVSIALSVKAARYLGLLIAIPLFATIIKKRVYLPWFLWVFLIAGIAGSFIAINGISLSVAAASVVKPIYTFLWASAMAATGLNADLKVFLSKTGVKCLIMACGGLAAAILVFLFGIMFMGF